MIPGMFPRLAELRRKKISAAVLNRQVPAWDHLQEIPRQPPATAWQTFSQILLPAPAGASQRLGLAIQVAADFCLIATGLALAGCIRVLLVSGLGNRARPLLDSVSFPPAISLFLLYGFLFTLLGYSERLYHPATGRDSRRLTVVLFKVTFWSTLLACLVLATAKVTACSIAGLAATAPLNFLMMWGYRHARQRILARERTSNHHRNVLIIGAGPVGHRLAHALQQRECRGHTFRGFLDESQSIRKDVLGSVEDLAKIARREFIDEIVVAVPQGTNMARNAIWQARRNRIDVKLVPDLLGLDASHVTLEHYGGVPVLTLSEEKIPQFGLLLKRMIDVVLSAGALVLAAPLLAAISLAIKLDSPGPVLYSAPRLGLKGRRFRCYKFRTMVADADKLKEKLRQRNERKGAFFKMVDDPRITNVGRVLRRYSLDELPQLWNVLRGEMSLVGPRPHPLDDVERYQLEDFQRLDVAPGLTGLWQVTARRDPSFDRSMALDREYIVRWSLGMDFWILAKTVGALLRAEGA